MINVSIIGANGYTGLYLINILTGHRHVNLKHLVSRSNAGTPVTDLYPSLVTLKDKAFEELDIDAIAGDSDLCFCCLPHGASSELCSKLYHKGVKVIDLSADFRYNDLDLYAKWYKIEHFDPALNSKAVYGLTELYREQVKAAKIVANPGCYTTCSILPLYPLIKEKVISPRGIVIDAKSGTSGAGRKAEIGSIFAEVDENFKAYAVTTHRHASEIEEQLSLAAGETLALSFTPHLLPIKRGILSTIYADLVGDFSDVARVYRDYYGDSRFVHFSSALPEIKFVAGSNLCMIGAAHEKKTGKVILVSCLDNLIKGASGQAVQNMNVMFSLPEDEGLSFPPCYI